MVPVHRYNDVSSRDKRREQVRYAAAAQISGPLVTWMVLGDD